MAQAADRQAPRAHRWQLVEKALPDANHGNAQGGVLEQLRPVFNRWWILPEVDILLDGDGYRPDICGWRRERMPSLPATRPVALRPDWICEVLSESNATTDTIRKLRTYHRAGVPHYWLVDPATKTIVVHRHAVEGYQTVLVAEAGEIVRAEPFDAIELRVGDLFGEESE
jgi:Uma2 family endonuclease